MKGPATQQQSTSFQENYGEEYREFWTSEYASDKPFGFVYLKIFFLPCSFTRLSHALNLYSHVFPCSFKLLYIDSLPE